VSRLSRDAATVQPQSAGRSELNRTDSMAPGPAPVTAIGPVRQCPRPALSMRGRASPGHRCRDR
jgi:hypothetical protein